MMTYWLSLRKCSICSFLLFLLWLFPNIQAATPPSNGKIEKQILLQLKQRKGDSFRALLNHWQKRYGSQAVPPLLRVAKNRSRSDQDRYIALMGAARLGGKAISPSLLPHLKDSSWMIRSATLRLMGAFQLKKHSSKVAKLLKDPARVVRTDAVQTLERLRPKNALELFLGVLRDPSNFHRGRAFLVAKKALVAIVKLQPPLQITPKLAPLLNFSKDPELLRLTVRSLEILTKDKKLAQGPLSKKVAYWKKKLQKKTKSE